MRFQLLGPVEVSDGGAVPLGGPKQRTVLAALLLHANRVVQENSLTDLTWGDNPPAGARGQLQLYVSRLRKALGGREIAHHGGGYRIVVGPGELDLTEFDEETRLARADLTAGRDTDAAKRLRAALALWRGAALGGTSGSLTDREGPALAERRLTAMEDLFAVELRLGRHQQILGDLQRAVGEEPFRESFQAHLMTALHASGHTEAALRVHTEVRERLSTELGLDPGRLVQGAHQRILQGEVHDTRPAQLPADIHGFAGRQAEMRLLDAAADRPLIVISGMAGVGKTSLAVHWATTVADRFPDGILHVNLRGYDPGGAGTTPAEAIRGFLEAFDVPPQSIPVTPAAQIGLYRRLVAGKRLLVLLDNARDPDDVRPLLPNSPGCLAVVTSRHVLSALVVTDGAYPLPVDPLSATESRQLLAARLGADQVAAEPSPVDEIIDRCAGLPLAMTLVATRAAVNRRFTLAAVAGELRAGADPLDALSSVDRSIDVRMVFSWSFDGLSEDAAALFRLLGLHCGPDVTASAAAAMMGVPVRRAGELFAELADANLVVEHVTGRFTMHDLLRAYAGGRLPDDAGPPLRRVLDYYLHSAYAADGMLYPHRDEAELPALVDGVTPETFAGDRDAAAWLTAERPVLLAAVDQALGSGFPAHAFRLALALVTFLDRHGWWDEEVAALEQALAAAGELDDPVRQSHAMRVLGTAYARLGRYDRAAELAGEALALSERNDDLIGRARAHRDLAMLCWRAGRGAETLHHLREVLDLSVTAGLRAGPAFALYLFACVHYLTGEHERALEVCRAAVASYRVIGDRIGEAVAWVGCGLINAALGRDRAAVTCHETALTLRRETGERLLVAESLVSIGATHAAADRPADARSAWQDAHRILSELDHPDQAHVAALLDRTGSP
ncbi:AfsR/SARP family transcriptional regulator [Actinoplanes couchii]|nr:BTAD domain-containing putative transcriptional regulator [Actinoplanes couchii]MDR6317297.1 DNA-binding SARP family transcriptional activator [Actinoplanes couchii]